MRGGSSFLLMNLILFFTVMGFILVVFSLNSLEFGLEFVGLLAFMFLFAFGMFFAYHGKKFGWTMIAVTLFVLLLDTVLLMAFSRSFGVNHIITVFFSLAGLAVAFLNLRAEYDELEVPDFSKPEHYYDLIDKMEPK